MRKLKYPAILLTIIIIFLIVIGTVLTLYLTRKPSTQTTITTQTTPSITLRQVATGFTQPTDISSTTSDEKLYVAQQAGTIMRVTPNQPDIHVFMDITNKVTSSGEMGLLGLAFHPNYEENGYIFVNYIDTNKNTVIARYHVVGETVDPASEKILLQVEQPYSNHNGGDLAFGPDGYLYASLGDGGSAGDPGNNAQNLNSLLGKILRLDINTDRPYVVPADNPFVGREGVRPEIWAYGLRNPWRISFDAKTGGLYIADVGQGDLEEVDFQSADSKGGENYGWRCLEGTSDYNLEGCTGVNTYTPPVVEYSHDDGRCSITGGYVYRGSDQLALEGKYFYSDFCGKQLYYTEQKDSSWQQDLAIKTDFAISTFGVDSSGELYVADYNSGNIYRIEVIAS